LIVLGTGLAFTPLGIAIGYGISLNLGSVNLKGIKTVVYFLGLSVDDFFLSFSSEESSIWLSSKDATNSLLRPVAFELIVYNRSLISGNFDSKPPIIVVLI